MFRFVLPFLLVLMQAAVPSYGEDLEGKKIAAKPALPKEEAVSTQHSATVGGKKIDYTATAGTILHQDTKEHHKGTFFYVAYVKNGVEKSAERPITFCFNGGPGSSSVWLHLGAFGPRRISYSFGDYAVPPYNLIDNEYSLLDVSDLVFIDPISTGYSRCASDEDPKQFHDFEQDIKAVADFIRLYTTKNERWDSPKFLAGESYGTTRAAGLTNELHDQLMMYVNGIILISSVLDYQTIKNFDNGNDLPYIFLLPTYTASALYHQKLSEAMQKNPEAARKKAEHFALHDYALALLKGDSLEEAERKKIVEQLSSLTGLSQEYIEGANLRINNFQFMKELLGKEKRCIGRFDSRYRGIETRPLCEYALSDPSFEGVMGIYTAAFNQYIRKELDWKRDHKYEILANVQPWNFGKSNGYLNLCVNLREVMSANPRFGVFIASGYYDLATPYFATKYTVNHLHLDPVLKENVTMRYYEGGHMMYNDAPSLLKLNEDIKSFIQKTLFKKYETG